MTRFFMLTVLLFGLAAACQKKDPVQDRTVRDLEEEIILLKLKLQETENRLSERIRLLELERMQAALEKDAIKESALPQASDKAIMISEPEKGATQPESTPEPDKVEELKPEPIKTHAVTAEPTIKKAEPKPQPYGDALYGSELANNPAPVTEAVPDPVENPELAQIANSDISKTYNRASEELKNRRYQTAASLFQAIAEQYPDHRLAPNALYWLGESAYGQREYDTAIRHFQRVLDRYPESNKAPDALLKLGKSFERMGNVGSAQESYRMVISRFPNSRAAQIAQTWL